MTIEEKLIREIFAEYVGIFHEHSSYVYYGEALERCLKDFKSKLSDEEFNILKEIVNG